MADAASARQVVEEFLARQREMYAGGDVDAVAALLAEDVVWHVPGTSPIAGDHRGRDAVLAYFRLRRELAGGAIAVAKGGDAAHEEALVQLADGRARLGGEDVAWRTAGVYRAAGGRIAEAWLVPLDQERFDRAWAATRPAPFVTTGRLRGQDATAPRLLELFEAAFLEAWRDRVGATAPEAVEVTLRRLAPIRIGAELRIEVALDRLGAHDLQAHAEAFVEGVRVAEAVLRYAR